MNGIEVKIQSPLLDADFKRKINNHDRAAVSGLIIKFTEMLERKRREYQDVQELLTEARKMRNPTDYPNYTIGEDKYWTVHRMLKNITANDIIYDADVIIEKLRELFPSPPRIIGR